MNTFLANTDHTSPFYLKKWFILLLWLVIAIIFGIQGLVTFRYNNYLIFANTFHNLIHQQSLYVPYPQIHDDVNHYGAIFTLLIAPFAVLPNSIGLLLWDLANAFLLYYAIMKLPLKHLEKIKIGYLAIPCLIASTLSEQYNPMAGSFIILSFICCINDKPFWSAFFTMLGTFVKLYGVMGFAFFFFVKNKKQFIIACIFWAICFFILPMLFSSPQFVIQSYIDWFNELIIKNKKNIVGHSISIMGFVRDFFKDYSISNITFLVFGVLIFSLPYSRIKLYKHPRFRLFILASALLFPVLFSTGSEDVTYVIAITGAGIWFIFEENKIAKWCLLGFLLVILSDLIKVIIPDLYDKHKVLHSIYSVPFFLIWLRIIRNTMVLKPFITEPVPA